MVVETNGLRALWLHDPAGWNLRDLVESLALPMAQLLCH